VIKDIQIENFKSIEKQSISLGDFSVLIGENGVGKTNLIYAISFIKSVVGGVKLEDSYGSFALIPSELINKKNNKNTFSIKTCVINGDEKEYYIEYDFVLDESKPQKSLKIQREILSVRDVSLGEKKKVVIFERDREDVKVYPEATATYKVDTSVSAISVINHQATLKVRDIFNHVYITEADISRRIPLESRVTRGILLLRKNPEAYEKFLKIIKKIIPALSSLVDISDEVIKIISSPTVSEYEILFTEDSWNGQLSLKAGSHGDLRTLYILAVSLYAPKHSTLIFEEIENGIHTKRTRDLIDFLEKIAARDEKQFIISTHSSRIINKIKADDLILVKKSPENGSVYQSLKEVADMGVIGEILENGGEISELIN